MISNASQADKTRTISWPARVFALSVFLVLASCATSKLGRTGPPNIVVRNETQQHFFSVTVRESPENAQDLRRLGSVSPLLAGNSYSVRRGTNPAPLTDRAIVIWEVQEGNPRTVTVSIRDAVRSATGAPDEALVFRILPGGRVIVALEHFDQNLK